MQLYHEFVDALRANDQTATESIAKHIESEARDIAREHSHLTVTDPDFRLAAKALLGEEIFLLEQIARAGEDETRQHQAEELSQEALSRLIDIVKGATDQVIQCVTALNIAADRYIFSQTNLMHQVDQPLPKEQGTSRFTRTPITPEGKHVQRFKSQLSASLPKGWFVKESITILAPDGRANVISSSEPVAEGLDTEQYVKQIGVSLRGSLKQYRELALEPAQILGGRQGYIRHFEWTSEDGLTASQVQQYYCENMRGYTATATTYSSDFEQYLPQLRQLLGGLRLEDGASHH